MSQLFSGKDKETDALKSFISVGGNVDNPQEYTRISAIVSK